jgi:hypothetical protein
VTRRLSPSTTGPRDFSSATKGFSLSRSEQRTTSVANVRRIGQPHQHGDLRAEAEHLGLEPVRVGVDGDGVSAGEPDRQGLPLLTPGAAVDILSEGKAGIERNEAMVRIIAVVTKKETEVVEYVVIEDSRPSDLEAFLETARAATRELAARYGLPNETLEIFDGSDRSVESLFRMFPNLKLTPRTARSSPRRPQERP